MTLMDSIRENAGILIVLLLVVMAIVFISPNHFGLSLTGSGFQVLGFSNPNYNSNDPAWNAASVTITAVANGAGQSAQGTISPSQSMSLFNVPFSQPVTITTLLQKDQCRYQISNVSTPVYFYTVTGTRATSAQTGYCICAAADTSSSSGYVGVSPLVCPAGYGSTGGCRLTNSASCPAGVAGCQQVYKKQIGTMNKADPSGLFYDLALQINETVGNSTYSGALSWQNQSFSGPAFRAQLATAGLGPQACPSVTDSDIAVFVNSTPSSSPLRYVSGALVQNVINSGNSIVDVNTAIMNGNSYNALVSQMVGSSPNVGQYASFSTNPANTSQTAFANLQTVAMTSVPIFTMTMNMQNIGVHVPSGMPKIQNVTVQSVTAATAATIDVGVLNTGETDSFDVAVQCPQDVSPFSTRVSIPSGTSQDVLVHYSGAGIISQCVVTAKSVGSPQNMDNQTVKLTIFPFCARSAPNPAARMVFTSKGCGFVCPAYGNGVDVFDASCGVLSNYSRCIDANCTQEASYAGYHCTAVGQATSMNIYMDDVAAGRMQPFIPEIKPHQFFMVTVDGTPVCQYIDEYGYSNGQPLSSLVFDYAQGYPQAQVTTTPTNPSPPSQQVPTQPPAGTPVPPSQQQPPQQTQGFDLVALAYQNWMLLAGAVIIIGGVYWWTRMRK